jgi:hypothetical protein
MIDYQQSAAQHEYISHGSFLVSHVSNSHACCPLLLWPLLLQLSHHVADDERQVASQHDLVA